MEMTIIRICERKETSLMRNYKKWIALFCAALAVTISACGTTSSTDLAPDAAASGTSAAVSSASSASDSGDTGDAVDTADQTASADEAQEASVSSSAQEAAPGEADSGSDTDAAGQDETAASSSSASASSSETEEEVPPEESASTDEDLGVILTEIAESVHAGEAGSSLKSTIAAADVLDFTMRTELSADQIMAQTGEYLQALPESVRMEYPDKVMFVGEAIHTLRDGDAASLLDSAGVTESGYPWTDEAYEKADAILQGCGI